MRYSWTLSRAGGRAALLVASLCVGAKTGPARAENPHPACELAAIGNDEILWLVVGTSDPKQQEVLQWFYYLDGVSTRVQPASRIGPQVGQIKRGALLGEALHVFFSNGAHYRYTTLGARREIRLPGAVVPEALGGDSASMPPRLWAAVRARTADAVEADWQETLRRRAQDGDDDPEAFPGDRPPAITSRPAARVAGTCHLVQYDGADWQPGFAAPEGCGSGGRLWLCVSVGRQYLLWQHNVGDSEIQYAWHERGHWTVGPQVTLARAPRVGFAGVVNTQLVFAALVNDPGDRHRLQCESWVWLPGTDEAGPGRWDPMSPPTGEQGEDLYLPVGSAVTAFRDQFALLRTGEAPEEVEVGLWSTKGGPPNQPFGEIPAPQVDRRSKSRRHLTDLIAMLGLAAVVLVVFWRRQEGIANPVALPAGLPVAGLARRAVAAVVDILPAAALVTWLWFDPITRFSEEWYELYAAQRNSQEQLAAPLVPSTLSWAWVWFRLLYAAYCTVFELSLAATPGKRLVGCTVLSESLARPRAAQIAIRNVTRLLELEWRLLIWPFLLVVFLTRNRQRLGDLLARTIVVEGRAPLGEEVEGSDDIEGD